MKPTMREQVESGALLGVDIEAQIRKTLALSHRAPEHYVVELVRGASRRKARRIDVRLGKKTVEIRDDGVALDRLDVQALLHVFNGAHPMESRFEAISHFDNQRGLGLLAAFGADPQRLSIASSDIGRSIQVEFRGRQLVRMHKEHLNWQGTRIVLHRDGDPQREAEAIREHCRFLGERIILNRKPLPRRYVDVPVLKWEELELQGEAGPIAGYLWLPAGANLSRIWFLEDGVVWKQSTIPWRRSGWVFEAAVETSVVPNGLPGRLVGRTGSMVDTLLSEWERLTQNEQMQLEELIFRQFEVKSDPRWLDRLPGFQDSTGHHHSLHTVQEMAQRSQLSWTSPDEPPPRDGSGTTVLILNPIQQTFLEKQGVSIPRLPSPQGGNGIRIAALKFLDWAVQRLVPTGRFLAPDELEPVELQATKLLEQGFATGAIRTTEQWPSGVPSVVFSDAFSLTESRVLKASSQWVLVCFRRHPRAKRALKAFDLGQIGPALLITTLTGGKARLV